LRRIDRHVGLQFVGDELRAVILAYKTDMSKLYTPCDAAQVLGISCAALKQWIYPGKFKNIQTGGGHHRIPEAKVDRLLPHQWTQSTHWAGQ